MVDLFLGRTKYDSEQIHYNINMNHNKRHTSQSNEV